MVSGLRHGVHTVKVGVYFFLASVVLCSIVHEVFYKMAVISPGDKKFWVCL